MKKPGSKLVLVPGFSTKNSTSGDIGTIEQSGPLTSEKSESWRLLASTEHCAVHHNKPFPGENVRKVEIVHYGILR